MYTYILVCTYTYLDVQTKNGMYWYILVCTDHVTGFRGKHRDALCWRSLGLLSSQNMEELDAARDWNCAQSQHIPQKTIAKHWCIDALSKAVESGRNYAWGRQFESYSYAYFSYSFVLAYTATYGYIQVCTCMNRYISIHWYVPIQRSMHMYTPYFH